METMSGQQDIYNKALESTGSLEEANAVKAESIQGRIATLKNSINEVWQNAINSKAVKESISLLNELISRFGNLKTAIGLATSALIIFKGASIASTIAKIGTSIVSMTTSIGLAIQNTGLLYTVMSRLSLINPYVALGVAVAGLTVYMATLGNEAKNTTKKIEELDGNIKKTQDSIDSLKSLGDRYIELSEKIDKSSEELKEYKDIQNKLAEQYPSLLQYYDAEGNAHLKNKDAIEQEAEALKKKKQEEYADQRSLLNKQNTNLSKENNKNSSKLGELTHSKNTMEDNNKTDSGSYDYAVEEIEKVNNKIKENNTLLDENSSKIRMSSEEYSGLSDNLQKLADKMLENTTQSFNSGKITMDEYIASIDRVSNALNSDVIKNAYQDYVNIANANMQGKATNEETEMSYQLLKQAMLEAKVSSEDFDTYVGRLTDSLAEQGAEAENTKQSIEQLGKEYATANDKVKGYGDILKELHESNNNISYDTMDTIISKYPELLQYMGSAQQMEEGLLQLIDQEKENRRQLIDESINGAIDDANNKIDMEGHKQEAVAETGNQEANTVANTVNSNIGNYNMDYNSFLQALDGKLGSANEFGNNLIDSTNSTTASMAQAYQGDLDSFIDGCNKKIQAGNEAGQKIANMWKSMGASNPVTLDHLQNGTGSLSQNKVGGFVKSSPWYKEQEAMVNAMNQAKKDLAGSVKVYAQSGIGHKTISVGGNGKHNFVGGSGQSYDKNGDKKKKAGKEEKEIANMEKLSDRYYEVNNALQKVNNELDRYNQLLANAEGKDKIDLERKSIDLLTKKAEAQRKVREEKQKDLEETKKSLSSNGFKFNDEGDITNANARLDALVSWANTQNSKDVQDNVKKMGDAVSKYTKLLLTDIPQIDNDILGITNTIVSAQKEISSVLSKQREEYIEKLEKETEATKKEMQERKDAYNKVFDDEDFEDDLKTKQDSLLDLQSALLEAKKIGNEEEVKNLRKQIQEQQKLINDTIRDKEITEGNDRFDKELDNLEETAQNKIDEINKKLSDEEILKLVQGGVTDLNEALNNINTSTQSINDTFVGVGIAIEDTWLTNLDEVLDRLSKINVLTNGLNKLKTDANDKLTTANNSNNVKIDQPITIQGNVEEGTLEKLKAVLQQNNDKMTDEIVTHIMKIFSDGFNR